MPVVTYFFLFCILIFHDFAIIAVAMKSIIMNPIDVHLFSSISTISSNAKVAIIPPITANTIRFQNSLSVSFFVADLSSKTSTVCLVSFGDIFVRSVWFCGWSVYPLWFFRAPFSFFKSSQ